MKTHFQMILFIKGIVHGISHNHIILIISHNYSKSGFQIELLKHDLDKSFLTCLSPSGGFSEPPRQKRVPQMNYIDLNELNL